MADIYTRILLSCQSGSTLRTIQSVSSALGRSGLVGDLEKVAQAAKATGLDVSRLDTLQAKAGESAARLGLAEARAAESLKRANDLAASGSANAEKLARANAQAALAAEKVKVAQNAAGNAMQRVSSEASRLSSAMENVSSKTDRAMKSLGGLGEKVKGIAVPQVMALTTAITGIGLGISDTMSKTLDFQEAMLNIAGANPELTAQQLEHMRDAILSMGPAVRKGPQDLAEGLYYVAGAGYEGAEAMDILRRSAMAAAAGLTETTVPANAATAILKAFPGLSVAQTFDMLTASVNTGKTELKDFAPAIGTVALHAQRAGVRFEEAASSLSILSNVMPSTEEAATSLKSLLQTSSRFEELTKRAEDLGLTFDTNAYKSMNFIDRLRYLQQVTGGNEEAIAKLLGQEEALPAITKLLTNGSIDYAKALNNVTTSAGAAEEQFKKTGEGEKATWASVAARINSLQIKIGDGLLPVVDTLVSVFDKMITVGINVVKFFRDNEVAMVALQSVLIAISAVILIIVVPAFIAWAATMIPVVVGALTLAAPFILIGVIIAAIVFGIIMAIRHWGAIVAWLQSVWGAFSSWFVAFFTGLWSGISSFFSGLWAGIIAGLQAAWAWIVNIVQIGAQFLLMIILGPFLAIGAAFVWLYQHNRYIRALVNFIVDLFAFCVAWLIGVWQVAIAWLAGAWASVVAFATDLWGKVSGAIQVGFSAAIGFVAWIWGQISAFFVNAWGTYIAGPLTSLWNNVSKIFSSAWGTYVSGPLGSLWNSISNWFAQLGRGALESGRNFISMLVDGISSGAGAIWNAVSNIASNIWSALGFHSPAKAGPASDADEWMPNLIKMLSSDLVAGAPQIEMATSKLASPLRIMSLPEDVDRMMSLTLPPVETRASGAQSAYTPTTSDSRSSTIVYAPTFNISTMARSREEVRRLAAMVNDEMSREFRIESSGYASGGIY